MHDLDRTTLEQPGDYEMEYEGAYDDFEFEYENDLDRVMDDDEDDEYEMEFEYEYLDDDDEYEFEYDDMEYADMEYGDMEYGVQGPFDEQMEMELAAELLTVQDDEDMDQFFGAIASALAPAAIGAAKKLLPKVAKGGFKIAKSLFGKKRRRRKRRSRRPRGRRRPTPRRSRRRRSPRRRSPRRRPTYSFSRTARRYGRRFMNSNTGQALKDGLRYTGRQALSGIGKDIGGRFFGDRGERYGGKFGTLAADAFGLELEGMSPEDQEFEVARRFVRLAGDATREAMEAPKMLPPKTVAKQAIKKASVQHAPGLARKTGADKEFAGM
jgi:hypothetical protein